MSNSALSRLVDVGRSGDFDRLETLFAPAEQKFVRF